MFCFKNDENLVNMDLTTQKTKKIKTLIGPFCAKYITFDLKKDRGVFHNTEKSSNILRETDW